VLVSSPWGVSNNTQKIQRLHTLFFEVTNVWKECELIVKNDSEEFGLLDNRDESTIEHKFWIRMSAAKSAEMHTECFAAREFEAISVSPVWQHVKKAL